MNASERATEKGFAIIVDGPVASGKGTISKHLAEKLHGFHMNTGAMYRGLTLFCLDNNIPIGDTQAALGALEQIEFVLEDKSILVNGRDVSQKIREQQVSNMVYAVSEMPEVRQEMVHRQQALGEEKMEQGMVVVVDARDGYIIFPDAKYKLYLTADVRVRAQRRFEQMHEEATFEQVLSDTIRRDKRDMERAASPLLS